MDILSWFSNRPRLTAFLIFISIFMVIPPYVERANTFMNMSIVAMKALSAAVIYQFVVLIWPSLLLHIPVYYFLYKIVKGDLTIVKYFMIYTGLLYLFIAFGQGIAYIGEYGLVIITNNLIVISIIGLMWFRDYGRYVSSSIDRSVLKLVPLALFAYIAPIGRTGYTSPPWWGLWMNAFKGNLLSAIQAFTMDIIAGYGSVAYCLFTPLALVIALSTRSAGPLTVRLMAITGLTFAVLIWISAGYAMVSTQLGSWRFFEILWNAILHIPLFTICGYAFVKKYTVS